MQFRIRARKPRVVFSVEEVPDLLIAAPGSGLKYRAALRISKDVDLRATEVCQLRVTDIGSHRMLIHVEQSKRRKDWKVISLGLLDLLRECSKRSRPKGWLFPGKLKTNPISSRQLNRAFTSVKNMAGISKHATLRVSRYSLATHLLEANADIRVIKVLLGRAKVEQEPI